MPKLLTPPDRSQFSYYPRLVDLRWTPSAGDEPVAYEVELEIEAERQGRLQFRPERQWTTGIPYHPITFSGEQAGRWRVRARNQLGASDWSKFRTFRFDV